MKVSNSLAITRIGILVVIAFVLIGIMILLLNKKNKFSDVFNTSSKIIYNDKFNAIGVKDLIVRASTADVQIQESSASDIEVLVYGKKKKEITVSMENNVLKVERDILKNFCIGFCFNSSKIVIKVPTTYNQHFKVKTISGEINIENFKSTNMNISSTSGDINIVAGNELDVSTIAGGVTIESGNSLKGSSTSGDMNITSLKNICDLKSISGLIKIERLSLIEKSMIKTVSGDVEISHINDVYVDTDTISGDVSVGNSNRQSQVELKIKTTSGNIDVGKR